MAFTITLALPRRNTFCLITLAKCSEWLHALLMGAEKSSDHSVLAFGASHIGHIPWIMHGLTGKISIITRVGCIGEV